MKGIVNFLYFVNENWTSIMVMLGLLIGLYTKVKDYLSKSQEEKIAIAKTQIRESMLKMITDAEIDFETWNDAGSIKRSQVIKQIFDQYPILSKVVDQQELIVWIDDEINYSLKTLRKIVKNNDADTAIEQGK